MALTDLDRHNLNTIIQAAKHDELGLMETTTKAGERAVVLCAITSPDGKQYAAIPLAKLFNGQPHEELNPPDGGKLIDPAAQKKAALKKMN